MPPSSSSPESPKPSDATPNTVDSLVRQRFEEQLVIVKQRIEHLDAIIASLRDNKRPVANRCLQEAARLKQLVAQVTAGTEAMIPEELQIASFLDAMARSGPTTRGAAQGVKVALMPAPQAGKVPIITPAPTKKQLAPRRKKVPHPHIVCEQMGALMVQNVLYSPHQFRIWVDPNGIGHFVYVPESVWDQTSQSWWNRVVFMIPGAFGIYQGDISDACFKPVKTLWNKIEFFRDHAWFAQV